MNKLNKVFMYAFAGLAISFTACNDDDVTPTFNSNLEDLSVPAESGAYYGQDKAGEKVGEVSGVTQYANTYQSGKAVYSLNYYDEGTYDYWNGYAYSNQTDNTKEGMEGQFVAYPGEGANNSEVYGIYNGFGANAITFEEDLANPQSIQLTNNAYAYYSMQKGDGFAKKFGGADGTDPDYFKVIITGWNAEGAETGTVEFYLADFRFEDDSQDYIVDSWETVDLSPLGTVSALTFEFESTDAGEDGINTPLYVAFDNLITQDAVIEE